MKRVTIRDLHADLERCLEDSQEEAIVVTRRGRPAALLLGVEGRDWETLERETDPEFWHMLAQRRKQEAVGSETYYGMIERGQRRPSATTLIQLSEVLEMSREERREANRLLEESILAASRERVRGRAHHAGLVDEFRDLRQEIRHLLAGVVRPKQGSTASRRRAT